MLCKCLFIAFHNADGKLGVQLIKHLCRNNFLSLQRLAHLFSSQIPPVYSIRITSSCQVLMQIRCVPPCGVKVNAGLIAVFEAGFHSGFT